MSADHSPGPTAWLSAARREPSDEIDAAWAVCSDIFRAALAVRKTPDAATLHDELLFCLLGGHGVTYELARSTTAHIRTLDPFNTAWSDHRLERRLAAELDKPQFEPRKSDGHLRRYRFPERKARLVVKARAWMADQDDLVERLIALPTDLDRRQELCACPGLGPKSATWLLRNLGLASELAIIDVHISRALVASGRVAFTHRSPSYAVSERAFLDWCREIDAPPPAFDLFLWEWQRGSLRFD